MDADRKHPSRRRVMTLVAAAAGLAMVAARSGVGAGAASERTRATAPALPPELAPVVWEGYALGARASLRLYHPDRGKALELIAACVAEIERLERILSLHRPDSALVRLNRDGVLDEPPPDLVRLLAEARRFWGLSHGAFDVTVGSLWNLYAAHFREANPDPAGPPAVAVAEARARLGQADIDLTSERIRLARPGMAVTLDGIGQGYITDRVADLLRAHGVEAALLSLGETLALGPGADGRAFTVGIADPQAPDRTIASLALPDGMAVATSGGYGHRFAANSACHPLFDPATGRNARQWAAVSVMAATATTADALSTALFVLPPERAGTVLTAAGGGQAILIDAENRLLRVVGTPPEPPGGGTGDAPA